MKSALLALCAWGAALGACAPADPGGGAVAGTGGAPARRTLVELLSWWRAPGEGEALQALIAQHRTTHPDVRVFNAVAVSGSAAGAILMERTDRRDPPDLLQSYAHELRVFMARHPGQLERLDDLFDRLRLREAMYPEVLADVSAGGHVVAMPVNIHRENALFYNKAIFAAHGLTPPTTPADLVAVCRKLKAAGVTPIATSYQGWVLRIVFNALASGTMGSAGYHDFFTGKSSAAVPRLREAIALFGDVLRDYVNPDAGEEGFNWTSAAQAVFNGDAAMMLHGDWAKGYFVALGWIPGVDFGVVGAPGASDLFLYGVDGFAIPAGAANRAGALEFLTTVASVDGQLAFNRFKGSSPFRRDVPREKLDPVAQATLDDLQRARFRMLVPNRKVWDDAFAAFAVDRSPAALLRAFIDHPPTMAETP